MNRRDALLWIPLAQLVLSVAQPAMALEIELSFPGSFANRMDARGAMQQAAAVWEQTLRDAVTVRIDVFESDPVELGDAQGATAVTYDFIDYSFSDFRDALASDATSIEDALAVSHLQVGPRMTFRMWDAEMNPVLMDDDEWFNNYVSVPRATAKAVGLPHDNDGPDAEIYWNASYLDSGFDFDRSDGIEGTDFLAVAMHETGHALGFTSGVNFVELVFAGEVPIPPEWLPILPVAEPLDLFRYSTESGPYFDLSPGGSPYFSVDGGVTNLAAFASGVVFGNGDQPDHWQDGTGIMDAYLEDDTIHDLSPLDRLAMDVIGWDLAVGGDFNGDGSVDAADYVVWRKTDGSAAGYDAWRTNFGRAPGSGSTSQQGVPEPATAFLLTLSAALASVRRLRLASQLRPACDRFRSWN